jgi:hypothetical protein
VLGISVVPAATCSASPAAYTMSTRRVCRFLFILIHLSVSGVHSLVAFGRVSLLVHRVNPLIYRVLSLVLKSLAGCDSRCCKHQNPIKLNPI